MADKRRITIVGGGIAGYPAAIRAARQGASVTMIEKAELGGTCLNRGCIPTKSLLQSVEVLRTVQHAKDFGIKTAPAEVDLGSVMKRKDSVVGRLRKGVASLVAARKVNVIQGVAEVLDPKTVRIAGTGEKVPCDAMILTTGSVPSTLPIPGLDKADAWSSDEFLEMKELPRSAGIIGGGVIGVELAQILAGFGCKVTVLEMLPQLVPGMDREISGVLETELKRQGVEVVREARVTGVGGAKKKRILTYTAGNKDRTLEVERVIVAVGRKPAMDGVNAEKLGLAVEKGALKVNERMETGVPGVYAAGDVTGGIMLAHVATVEGECAAINATGGNRTMDTRAVPSCVYTTPEVASVGLSEEAAKEKHEIQVGRFPFMGCGKALVLNQRSGMVKIVADKQYGEVLGVHIIGPHATDLIAEAVLGMTLEATVEEFAHAIHPHPTLSEAVMEAALSLTGGAIHMP